MSDFYSKVVDIISASSKEEATTLLFGPNSGVYSQEITDAIIAKFTRKKERIIDKIGDVATFDLSRDVKYLYEIMFISTYIQSRWEKEKKQKQSQRDKLKGKDPQGLDPVIQQEIEQLNARVHVITTNMSKHKGSKQLRKAQILNGPDIRELREAIHLIQVLRDSLQHNDNNKVSGQRLEIQNVKGFFDTSIPMSYLDGFATGSLKALPEDKDVVKKTNDVLSPILQAINYDPAKLEGFFYNVSPAYLSFLLDKCNNNMDMICQLPLWCFDENKKSIIDFVLGRKTLNEKDLSIIKNIHINSDVDPENVISTISYIFNKDGYNENTLKFIGMMSPQMFNFPEECLKMLIHLENGKETLSDQDFKMLEAMQPHFAFNVKDKNYSKALIRNGIWITDYLRTHNQNNGEFRECDILLMKQMSIPADYCGVIEQLKRIDYHRKNNPDFSKEIVHLLSDLSYVYSNSPRLRRSQMLEYLAKTLNGEKPMVPKETEFGNVFIKDGLAPFNLVSVVEKQAAEGKEIDETTISGLKKFPNYFGDSEVINGFLKVRSFITNDEKRELTSEEKDLMRWTHEEYYKNPESFIGLISFVKEEDKSLTKEQVDALKNGLHSDRFSNDARRIIDAAHAKDSKTYISTINTLCEYGLETESLPNVDILLSRVNGDLSRLSEFPREMFTVDSDVLNELLTNYDYNICRSIFGMDNPKLMAAMIYANSVFSRCPETIRSGMNIDVDKIALDCVEETVELSSANGLSNNMTKNDYFEQFVGSSNDTNLSQDEMNVQHFVSKMRNASAHFRMLPVVDNNGVVQEDKVYIYDEDKNDKNFRIIMNLDRFVEITRQVEIEIGAKIVSAPSTSTGKTV